MKEQIRYAFGFEVEWENGYLYIAEEDGSGAKYACRTIEEVVKALGNYIAVIQFDKSLEDEAKEYELMEENREY